MTKSTYALVTGAAGGIGLEVARRLAARGHRVLAVERDRELAAEAARQIGPTAEPVACDLADDAAVAALADRIEHEWGPDLEICFLNAGIIIPGDVVETSPRAIDLQLRVMLTSAIALARAAARALRARGSGHIVATVSQGAVLALPGSATYTAAKAGLRGFLAALHLELRATGVRVSGVYPSAVDTPMLRHEAENGGSVLNFVGKLSTVAEVADGVDTAMRTGRVEVFVPFSDGVLVRLLQAVPRIVPVLLPALQRVGERGRLRYLARPAG
ncbi:SDR family oxidoreductase [Nocardia puris]|uniref:SDR family NAD(P)-dependent oxidoreductase n=1 Tax=Nocardia puris TaxID=208602 RepID=UPI001895447A|nr:SDR family oxidoreductase [Nocardia puris]MBF6214731.1 SDR family oxidoreductase [Nocardia puris]MBF6368795.1 SDR family oxidoreductase [Nocardia puris]MBF6462375.1 SDR family oxidoreductase [Nocardia puris]